MSERRVSGWFILSAIFIVLVFGLFFTFTERKTWPENKIELGPMDMRLVPPVSTLWCQAVALHSDHAFVAYQVNQSGQINPLRLTSQIKKLGRKTLGRSWFTNFEEYKYFLLPASVIEIVACSWYPDVKLLVFKGDTDVLSCLQNIYESLINQRFSERFPRPIVYDSSMDDSSEDDSDYEAEEASSSSEMATYKKVCPSLLHSKTVDLNDDEGSMECNPYTKIHPIKVNISSADYYIIAIWNVNPEQTNYVNLRIMLDRTRYVVQKSGQAMDICSMSKTCTIGLNFASGDRVLVSVPDESSAGRSTVVIRSRCKPRLAVFAILSVFLPLLLFMVVAFVVRADRQSFGKYFCKRRESSSRVPTNSNRIISPLLEDHNVSCFESPQAIGAHSSETTTVQVDDMPPPYYTLYDAPPPYACVNDRTKNTNQT